MVSLNQAASTPSPSAFLLFDLRMNQLKPTATARLALQHRRTYQRPISAEGLMRTLGLGASRSRLLVRTVRAAWDADHLALGADGVKASANDRVVAQLLHEPAG